MNIERQIARVIAAQGLSRSEAQDQIKARVYQARRYVADRAFRKADDTFEPDGTEGARRPQYTMRERPIMDDDGKF